MDTTQELAMKAQYGETSIKILTPDEVHEQIAFARIQALTEHHQTK